MDLDEMKNQAKRVKAPGIDLDPLRNRSANDLIAALKSEDARDKKKFRWTMLFFGIAGVFYTGIFLLTWIAPPDDSPNTHRVILGLFATLFLSLGVYGRRKSRELAGIDYTEPSSAFLGRVERRYRFVQGKELVTLILFVVILAATCAFGLMMALERYFPSLGTESRLVACSVFFVVALAGGLLLSWQEWKRRKEPLLRKVREMQVKLTSQEPP